jgi:hypothetical protein
LREVTGSAARVMCWWYSTMRMPASPYHRRGHNWGKSRRVEGYFARDAALVAQIRARARY